MQKFKIVLLGEGRVGKTSLVLRYVQNTFSSKQESTIQASYLDKRLNIGKQSVNLMIWDTAGQERFHALGPIYYRDANGALLVYDITDRDSFNKVRNWVKELRTIVGDQIVVVIAGNKCDMEKERQVNDQEAKEYAQSVGAIHVATSAKNGKGVEETFLELTKQMLPKFGSGANANGNANAAPQPGQRRPSGASKRGAVLIDDSNTSQDKGSCC